MKFFVIREKELKTIINICLAVFVVTTLTTNEVHKHVMATHHNYAITCVETEEQKVSLTFTLDKKVDTTEILKLLGEDKATFFVTLEYINTYPEDVLAISKAGHEVDICIDESKVKSTNELMDELAASFEQSSHITMSNSIFVRFLDNSYSDTSIGVVKKLSLYPIQWNKADTDEIISKGDIILVTDYSGINSLKKKLDEQNLEIVPISSLINLDKSMQTFISNKKR